MSFTVETHDPAGFLERAEAFLRGDEARHNLMLGLALSRAAARLPDDDAYLATVLDADGGVAGCVLRTPPHKVLVTDLPREAAEAVVESLSTRFTSVPAILGAPGAAEAVGQAWIDRHGGTCTAGMAQGVYRLDRVQAPEGVPGSMRLPRPDEVDLLVEWGEGFGRDTGIPFPPGRDPILHWLHRDGLWLWDDEGEPVSVAVAHGRTGRGVRIGYVYTPPERRGRGYASAVVAALSQRMLDRGCAFCVLYTDLSNPTSNGVYRRIGYRLIEEVRDYDLAPPAGARPDRGT